MFHLLFFFCGFVFYTHVFTYPWSFLFVLSGVGRTGRMRTLTGRIIIFLLFSSSLDTFPFFTGGSFQGWRCRTCFCTMYYYLPLFWFGLDASIVGVCMHAGIVLGPCT